MGQRRKESQNDPADDINKHARRRKEWSVFNPHVEEGQAPSRSEFGDLFASFDRPGNFGPFSGRKISEIFS
jgi:hypothetical protein